MKREIAEYIADNFDGEIYENYSGRGMFGKTTTGVVLSKELDFFEFARVLIEDDVDFLPKGVLEDLENRLKVDNLGMDLIYY